MSEEKKCKLVMYTKNAIKWETNGMCLMFETDRKRLPKKKFHSIENNTNNTSNEMVKVIIIC